MRVKEIMPSTPAEKAGLKVGDEVLSIDDQPVKEPQQLIDLVTSKGRRGRSVASASSETARSIEVDFALEARPDELGSSSAPSSRASPRPAFAPRAGPRARHPAKLADLAGNVVVVEFWAFSAAQRPRCRGFSAWW